MSKSIKQLREQLEILQQTVIESASQLEESYGQYLEKLGDSVGKQLVLASYQVCTQKYPEKFLKLSLSKRHSLQQKIKSFKLEFNKKLANNLLNLNYYNQEIIKNFRQIILKNEQELEEKELGKNQLVADDSTINDNDSELIDTENNLTPDSLIKFQEKIDHTIDDILQNISQTVNRYLQKQSILPNQLPPKILDMALQAEESASMTTSAPNLLSLLIERQQDSEAEERDITSITAICMRLSEIEFADHNLAIIRNQIRTILAKVDKTRDKYNRIQVEYAIAEAEAAWRSSWTED